MDEQLQERFKTMLLNRPGKAVTLIARELGMNVYEAQIAAKAMGLGKQRQRILAAGRGVGVAASNAAVERVNRIVALRPGLVLHFDCAVIGRFVYGDRTPPRDLVAYSMVDRCSGYAWARCCDQISGVEAAASVREFAANSPFPTAGAAIVTDGRGDVQSEPFRAACVECGLSQRLLTGGRPWGNSIVEQQHRFLRIAGLAGVPFEQLQSWESLVDFVRTFTHEVNTDRSLIFATSLRVAPVEVLQGMLELGHLPALERALRCRLLNRLDIERAKPMRVSDSDADPLFVPIADALGSEHLSSLDLQAVLTTRKIKHKFKAGEGKGVERVPNRNERGFYLYV